MKTLRMPVYLFVVSMTVAMGGPSTVFAQFNLDKLKNLAEQAKAYQEKLKQVSPSNDPAQTEPSAQANSDAVLPSETPVGNITQAGPNILGIQLGMAPSEVRKILARRPGIKIGEMPGFLLYQPASGERKEIPNSRYIKRLITLPGSVEQITVDFTPTAGRERVISVERRQTFRAGQQPTINATTEALVDKYGPFSYQFKPGGPFINYFWRFDSQAKLRDVKPDVSEGYAYNDICRRPARAALEGQSNIKSAQGIKIHQDLLAKFEKCGHTQIFAELDGGGARADAPVLRSLTVVLNGSVEAVAARRDVDRFVENYGKGEAGKEVREADKRKLDL